MFCLRARKGTKRLTKIIKAIFELSKQTQLYLVPQATLVLSVLTPDFPIPLIPDVFFSRA